jgi:hypothetical protein
VLADNKIAELAGYDRCVYRELHPC